MLRNRKVTDTNPVGKSETAVQRGEPLFDYKKLFDLTGRQALVVGAGSGIGEAAALGLAAHGAHVICADLNVEAAQKVADDIKATGGKAESLAFDMRDG